MGFATVLSALAFFIAMVALWLASDIVKKVESQNEKFVRAHLATLREELHNMDEELHKTSRMTEKQETIEMGLEKRLAEQGQSIQNLGERIAELAAELDLLDRSVPSRYRVRVVKADQKSDDTLSLQ